MPEIRLQGLEGEQLGIVNIRAALQMAEEAGLVAVRTRGGQDLGQLSVEALIERLRGEVAARSGTA